MEFTRLPGESKIEFIYRVCDHKSEIGTWDQVRDVLNEALGEQRTEASYRKKYTAMKKLINKENNISKFKIVESNKNVQQPLDDELSVKIRELEVAKIQYRDERNAWQKQNYIDARVNQKLDYLESMLKDLGRINFKECIKPVINGSDEMVIMLSDWHIGQCFNSLIGQYNSDIAKERVGQLLSSVKEYAEMYNVKKAHVCLLGDLLSGSIHKTIQVTNRENVIDQIKLATELISSFCYECCHIFESVFMYSVVGNHSRIDRKEDSLHSERLDDLIAWAVDLTLSYPCENFHYFKHRNLDDGIVDMNVCGKSYLLCHGDFDPATKAGASNLSMMLGFVPEAILRGHLHSPSFNEYNGVKVVQGGSLAGAGDQYTLEKRLFGKPSQTLLICDNKGIKVHIPVELN